MRPPRGVEAKVVSGSSRAPGSKNSHRKSIIGKMNEAGPGNAGECVDCATVCEKR